MFMDDRDKKIIEILRMDSRLPIREIAKKTLMRSSTVYQRIKRLKEDAIIEKFTIKVNDTKIGEDFIVFMLVKTKPTVQLELLNNSHVKEAFGVTGEYDLLLKLKFKGVSEFNSFIISFRKDARIVSTLTMVGTAKIKED